MTKIKYFDHAATTAVNEEVLKEMIPYFNINYGNPSSIYTLGRHAKSAIDVARQKTAHAIGANSNEIYFTGGGSESDNLAIKGVAYANKKRGNHIITTNIEHPAVLNTCHALRNDGFEITFLGVNRDGKISISELKEAIRPTTILLSIMFANNEIGTIQPIKEIGEVAKRNNIYFHTDAVQAIGNIEIDVNMLNIDLLSMSAHKFYGPKGVGALYVRRGVEFQKILDGGHQEKDKRAGTENLAGIVGMGKAIELAYKGFEEKNKRIEDLRNYFISELEKRIPKVKLNGHRRDRLPGNCNVSFEGVNGEALLLNLDAEGIYASTGSACSSGSSSPSHVLLAIGLPQELAKGSLRVALGDENTKEDVDFLLQILEKDVKKLRR